MKPPTGCGQLHAKSALLGAWGTVLRPVQEPGLWHQPLLPGGPWAPRGARAAPSPRLGSRRVARCSSPRQGVRGRPRWPPGWDGPARPPRPCRARAPWPPADARPRPEFWALAPHLPWGSMSPGPQSAKRLTGLTEGTRGGMGRQTTGGGASDTPSTQPAGGEGGGKPMLAASSSLANAGAAGAPMGGGATDHPPPQPAGGGGSSSTSVPPSSLACAGASVAPAAQRDFPPAAPAPPPPEQSDSLRRSRVFSAAPQRP